MLRRETSRHFRKKKRKYLKIEMKEISYLIFRKENMLSLLKTRVLRKIFVPRREEGTRRW
jgi:hypothetical protein